MTLTSAVANNVHSVASQWSSQVCKSCNALSKQILECPYYQNLFIYLRNKPIRCPGTTPMGRRELSRICSNDGRVIIGDASRAAFQKDKSRAG
ncbi:hypothetical protein Zmor_021597 [Zophobas morio]|uniref:Uncharacterized protein n=1 Tax=Zophobas morio TaxID=2755281 RepID=A0AA38MAL7_9CUCU|nr:hypothetical protein Zmor_021597 [Zophobas morio]